MRRYTKNDSEKALQAGLEKEICQKKHVEWATTDKTHSFKRKIPH